MVYVRVHLCMHVASQVCVSVCVHACRFLEGIDLSIIHRKVLKFQSLLWCSHGALPKDKTLMFYFPMTCLGIKAKKKEAEVC